MNKRLFFRHKREKGQSFVELGLSLVFLLLLLSAVIDLGWAFFTMVALRDSAQEAATVGSICPTDNNKVRARLMASATAPIDMSELENSQIEICIVNPGSATCGANVALGNSVQVSITYQHKIVTPFVGSFIGGQTYPLTVRAADTILRLNCDAIQ